MSRIEDALRKLQAGAKAPEAHSVQARSAVPIAKKKKVAVEGEKHHVDQESLIQGGVLAALDHAGRVADEFRKIKRPLIANATRVGAEATPHQNVVMIASGLPGAGKTFCSVNLAVSISLERELNVVLVDADVAKPHISRAFGLADEPGLIDLLLDESADIADVLVRTDLNDITVLPAGRRHPQATELLSSDRMSAVVKELATRYSDRLVLLDSPPLLVTSEAQALASHVGQIAIVVEAGKTLQHSLEQTVDVLEHDKPINIILNKTGPWGNRGSYYGEYGSSAYDNR